ncbi:autophagocytosis associated protein [Dissophora ornata]|nr:E2-like conjugating enzyme atg10 [Dissophora ornata]KAI8602129.1 autophagocytosis associated protein [Dissophora ornata]
MALETKSNESLTPNARLSYSDFEIAIKSFLKQAEHHSSWAYVEYRPRAGQQLQGYLAMTELKYCQTPSPRNARGRSLSSVSVTDQLVLDDLAEDFGNILDEEANKPLEAADLSQDISGDFLSVSYHILFSSSYQVPVLYFNAYRPDGTAISLEEIYGSLVPEEWRSSIRNAGLSGGISQQDHPILNVPYFYMHPCETVSLMETILGSQTSDAKTSLLDSYISTWLSFTGQAIGVTVPTDVVAKSN